MTQSTAVARPEAPTLFQMIDRMVPQMAKAAPTHVSAERMARIATTAVRVTPKLGQCSPASFLGALMAAATLGLEVNTPLGHAYLLPFESRKRGVECQLIVGYKGMMELARRSGVVRSIRATVVRSCDEFKVVEGLHPTLEHRPSMDAAERAKAPLTYVYAVAHLADGEPVFVWLSKAEVDKRRARSRAAQSGPWVTDYEAMAMKTAVRVLFPWLPQSVEVSRLAMAVQLDEAADRGPAAQAAALPHEIVSALGEQGLEVNVADEDEPEPAPASRDYDDALDREPGEDDE